MDRSEADIEKRRRTVLARLTGDLAYFASQSLVIRDKQGQLVPFIFNKAQRYAHDQIEAQRAQTGKVRALILKGRQQGMSTYTAARYYHKTIFVFGTTTFILSHQASTTGALFDIVKRYQEKLPAPLQPQLAASNKNQLKFLGRDSEYTVGTAGNEEIGRGFTIKQLHCSEIAKYERTDELETGLFQAVSDMAGTEIILESTANGMGNLFYRKCMDALAGIGEYILIFVPWFWQDEYRKAAPEGFTLTTEEHELKQTYSLDNDQIYWRRLKIIELGGDQKGGKWKFMQEYPMNVMEAFIVSGDPFFSPNVLMAARKRKMQSDPAAPKILGVDCARTNDRGALTLRQGRKVLWTKAYDNKRFKDDPDSNPTEYYVNIIANLIDSEDIDKVFIDMGGGYGIVDGLKRLGYSKVVVGVYFGQKASKEKTHLNKRVEMYDDAREWFIDGPVQIPDEDDFFTDLLVIPAEKKSVGEKMQLESKVNIKAKYGRSPDRGDSFVLTFAHPVIRDNMNDRQVRQANVRQARRASPFRTENRIRAASPETDRTISVKVNF